MRCLSAVIVASLSICRPVLADGLIQQLPEDTSWVLFKVEGFKDKTKKGGPVEHFEGHIKISSVGRVKIGKDNYRWIETEQIYRGKDARDSEERGQLIKLLIAEEPVVRDKSPLNHVLRGWVAGLGKFDRGGPREVRSANGKPVSMSAFAPETQFYLAGPAADVRSLEPELVECKLGKIKCAGLAGSIDTSSLPNPGNAPKMGSTFETRLHKDAPFGVVSYSIKLVEPDDDRVEMKATLMDFGDTALSRLPDRE